MEVNQLRHFLAASESLNFAQTARDCFTTRQNIAHSIRLLEQELGCKLFERTGNSLMLTFEGRRAAKKVREIIDGVDELGVMFAPASTGGLVLNVAFATNFPAVIPMHVLDPADGRSYSLRIQECDMKTCVEKVREGRVDVAFCFCMGGRFEGCSSVLLRETPTYAVVSARSDLAKPSTFSLSMLGDRSLLLLSEPEVQYGQLFDGDSAQIDRSRVEVIPSLDSAKRLIAQRDAVGIVSDMVDVAGEGALVLRPFDNAALTWKTYALFLKDSEKRAVIREFIARVKEESSAGRP